MSGQQTLARGASRTRRTAVAFTTVLLLASVSGGVVSGVAVADDAVTQTKHDLRQAKERVRDRRAKIRTLQRHMNALATRISKAEVDIGRTEAHITELTRKMRALQVRASLLQSKLDDRNRSAYMFGTAPVLYLLTATSAAEAASRMSFINEMNRRDAVLAAKVQQNSEALGRTESEVVRSQNILELIKRRLELDQKELDKRMKESRRILAGFQQRVDEIRYELSMLRPLAVCPVDGPHAIADNFGAPRPEPGGGFHWHQGDDIAAATGTPIVAPFDGSASVSHSALGGLGVYVHGEHGYVYNAHLSRLGKLGRVEVGDVIGYVGSTGHSSGPHDHFEWHPGNGDAVDPYDLLMLVC